MRKKAKRILRKMMKQKNNKFKIMSSFFLKNDIFLVVKILLIMIISLSYYIISVLIETSKKKEFYNYDIISNEILKVLKEPYDIFMTFKRELEYFEKNLEKCQVGNKPLYKLNLPTIEEIRIPTFGNNIMRISSDFGFKGKNIEEFELLFSEDVCSIIANNPIKKMGCAHYDEFLFQGIEQCVSKIGSIFGTIIEELDTINTNGAKFKVIFNKSKYQELETFLENYYQLGIYYIDNLFKALRGEILSKILKIIKIVIVIYIITTLVSSLILFYLIYNYHYTVNTYLYFIAILPFKYLSEDEKFYKEIIIFGNQYFGSN